MDADQHRAVAPKDSAPRLCAKMSTTAQAPKLKDSCDTCAASKIRCDKRKPLCGRCERLRYPCFYSPARRTGYSRPRSTKTSESVVLKPSARDSRVHGHFVAADWSTIRLRRGSKSCLSESTDSALRPAKPLVPASCVAESTGNTENELSYASAISEPEGPASTEKKSCGWTFSGDLTQGSDCAIAAINTVIQLQLATVKLQLREEWANCGYPDSGCGHLQQISQAAGLRETIDTITAAFRTLSTVLVCPCFGSPDIGLLAAAVFLSVLDVYMEIVKHSAAVLSDKALRPAPASDPGLACILAAVEDEFSFFRTSATNESSSKHVTIEAASLSKIDTDMEEFTADQLPGELAKVARIVLQFAKRYRDGDAEKKSPEFLQTLDRLLKSQLQFVTMETAI